MATRKDNAFDEDKQFLMCIIANQGINIMEECKQAAAKMGPGFEAEKLR